MSVAGGGARVAGMGPEELSCLWNHARAVPSIIRGEERGAGAVVQGGLHARTHEACLSSSCVGVGPQLLRPLSPQASGAE